MPAVLVMTALNEQCPARSAVQALVWLGRRPGSTVHQVRRDHVRQLRASGWIRVSRAGVIELTDAGLDAADQIEARR